MKNPAAMFQAAAPSAALRELALVAERESAIVAVVMEGLALKKSFIARSGIARGR